MFIRGRCKVLRKSAICAGQILLLALFVLAGSQALQSYAQCPNPPETLRAWWKAEGNANDSVGPPYDNGSYYNSVDPAYSWGYLGDSLAFDLGGTDYVDFPDDASSDLGTLENKPFTIMFFYLPRRGSFSGILMGRFGEEGGWYIRYDNSTGSEFICHRGIDNETNEEICNTNISLEEIEDSPWYFFAISSNEQSYHIYGSGGFIENGTRRNVDGSAELFHLGDGQIGFNGYLDHILFFDESLNEEQIYSIAYNVSYQYCISNQLQISLQGPGSGTVTSEPSGIDCGDDCSESYFPGTHVLLKAFPESGSSFVGWGDDCECDLQVNPPEEQNECVVIMGSSNRTCTATFQRETVTYMTLSITKEGNGSGTIYDSSEAIWCGEDCQGSYEQGDNATLYAEPDNGSRFVAWGGDCTPCGSDHTCRLTMNTNKHCSATFQFISPPFYTLTVLETGSGTGTVTSVPSGISCPQDCQEEYKEGSVVTLNATPAQGSFFVGWGGDCASCIGASCILVVNSPKSCSAQFDIVRYRLNVSLLGTGSGTVVSSPAGIQCPQDCQEQYPQGTYINLTAKPNPGSQFLGWGVDCAACSTLSCSISMSSDTLCEAHFEQYSMVVTATGDGDFGIYTRFLYAGLWSPWEQLVGNTSHAPAVAVFKNRLYMAVKGAGDNRLYVNAMDLETWIWEGWKEIPGESPVSPALVVFGDKLYLFYKGVSDDNIHYTFMDENNEWSSPGKVPWNITSDTPALAVFGEKLWLFIKGLRTELVFFRSMDSNGNWSPPHRVPLLFTSSGPSVSVFNGKIYLFVVDPITGTLLQISSEDPYSAWDSPQSISQVSGSSPSSAVNPADGKLYVAVKGAGEDNNIYYSSVGIEGGWAPWKMIPSNISDKPVIAPLE